MVHPAASAGADPLAALWLAEGRLRRAAAAGAYDPAYMTDDVWRGYYTPLKLRGASAALIKLIADVRRQPTLDPATVGARTLLLWGEADPATPLRIAHRLHATMPDARLEVIPRAGHLVLEEQPDACNAAILTFLAAENIISATGATAHV
ncbi:MAG: alpha/beta hydrolase [Dehalococcoidia bacterium]